MHDVCVTTPAPQNLTPATARPQVHVVAVVGGRKRKKATASFWASELNEFNTGWQVVNGTCGKTKQTAFSLGMGDSRNCEELSIKLAYSGATFSIRNWVITVRGNYVYGHVTGPHHRIDLTLGARGDAPALSLPHGMLGQSFATTIRREGKVDLYPSSGHFVTSAMAEGAVEGTPAMYEVQSPFETTFAFSRFGSDLAKIVDGEAGLVADEESEANAAGIDIFGEA